MIGSYKIRKGVPQKRITNPKGGPYINYQEKPKNHCNACWHERKLPYRHKHCQKALNDINLEPEMQIHLEINNW